MANHGHLRTQDSIFMANHGQLHTHAPSIAVEHGSSPLPGHTARKLLSFWPHLSFGHIMIRPHHTVFCLSAGPQHPQDSIFPATSIEGFYLSGQTHAQISSFLASTNNVYVTKRLPLARSRWEHREVKTLLI
eukprot:246447-Rhodomonas_salina.1